MKDNYISFPQFINNPLAIDCNYKYGTTHIEKQHKENPISILYYKVGDIFYVGSYLFRHKHMILLSQFPCTSVHKNNHIKPQKPDPLDLHTFIISLPTDNSNSCSFGYS